jgi:hypothetical protein
MNIFAKLKRKNAAARLIDEQMYEIVVEELQSGVRRNGLWAKALAKSQGDESKAKALYISYRVQSLRDESEIAEAMQEYEAEESRNRHQQYQKQQEKEYKNNSRKLQIKIKNLRNEGYSFYLIAQDFNEESVNIPNEYIDNFNKWSPELVKLIKNN